MKRILFHTLLTAGFFLLASGSAFAQRHSGFPEGPLNAGGPREGEIHAPAAHVEQAPAVRSEVRTNQPAIRNEVGNDHAGQHPFYGNDRGHDNDWRYGYHDNRWWYWTPLGAWAYWNDGRWQDYSTAVPYTTNYRGPVAAAPTGWYWNDNQKQYYWFDGTNLIPAQQ